MHGKDLTQAKIIATRVWIYAAYLKSGMRPYEIAKKIDPASQNNRDGRPTNSGLWNKYERGDASPDAIKGGKDRVALLEELVPGTKYWFDHPFWRSIESEPLNMVFKQELYEGLGSDIYNLLYEVETTNFGNFSFDTLITKSFNQKVAQNIIKVGGLDALTASILLMREAMHICSTELRKIAIEMYREIQPSIVQIAELQPFHGMIFDLIEQDWGMELEPFIDPRNTEPNFSSWRDWRKDSWPEDLAKISTIS